MSTELDQRLIPIAYDLVDRLGKQVVIKKGTPAYDATTGQGSESGVVDHSVKITPPQEYDDGYVPSDLIQRGDMKTYLPAKDLTFVPDPGDRMIIDSVTWRIEFSNPIYSGEDIALHELLLRR